jgi:hypothetical protein
MKSLIYQFSKMLDLERNWDGYDADTIDPASVRRALIFVLNLDPTIPLPRAAPVCNSDVQLEWHIRGIDMEIEFLGDTFISVLYENAETGEMWELEATGIDGRVMDAVRTLAQGDERRRHVCAANISQVCVNNMLMWEWHVRMDDGSEHGGGCGTEEEALRNMIMWLLDNIPEESD